MPLLWTGTEDIQWKTGGYRSPRKERQWKRERCAHQATVQRCPGCEQPRCLRQWREISEYETVACADCSSVQSTDRIGSFRRQRLDANLSNPLDRFESQTAWSKADWTSSRWAAWSHSRCQKRLAEAEIAKVEAEVTIIKETEDIASYRTQLAELEPLAHYIYGFRKGRRAEQRDVRIKNRQTHVGKQHYRQRGCCSVTSRVDGTSPSSCTSGRTTEWSIEQHYRHVRYVTSRGNKHELATNTNKVRLTTKTMIEETPQLEDIRNRRRSGMSDS